jgi:endogenous inhibitor of DNA gyrase (YacG/DUF329 family)
MTDRVRLKPCPICGKPAGPRLNPFCSTRCADVDLNRWFAGSYSIPASEDDEADEADGAGARDRRNDDT